MWIFGTKMSQLLQNLIGVYRSPVWSIVQFWKIQNLHTLLVILCNSWANHVWIMCQPLRMMSVWFMNDLQIIHETICEMIHEVICELIYKLNHFVNHLMNHFMNHLANLFISHLINHFANHIMWITLQIISRIIHESQKWFLVADTWSPWGFASRHQ